MANTDRQRLSRARTVRLDVPTHERLDALASDSDRTLAQLLRYALNVYFANDVPPPAPQGLPDDAREDGTRHVALRLEPDLVSKIEAHALTSSSTHSDVIRHAVALWLDQVDPGILGEPANTMPGRGAV